MCLFSKNITIKSAIVIDKHIIKFYFFLVRTYDLQWYSNKAPKDLSQYPQMEYPSETIYLSVNFPTC